MSDRKPLVLANDGSMEQLQGGDDLNIPLADLVRLIDQRQRSLIRWMLCQGFDLPPDVIASLETENLS